MSKKVFKFNAKVWVWPGYAGWHFVTLPKNLSKKIKKIGKIYGAGFVRVKVAVGKSTWRTALFPHKESESYLLSIKKPVRKKEGIWEDDDIEIKLNV